MANGWSPERKARQAELIHRWKPWTKSTGPSTAEGTARASRNAWQGGKRALLRTMSRIVSGEIHKTRELVLRAASKSAGPAIDG